jgi:hypothetical protein
LAIGAFKGDALADKLVEVGRGQVGISQRGDGVIALLVGAYPENIGTSFALIHAASLWLAAG